jgi:hypothetical protein
MDMESDRSDGDMGMLGIFRPTIIIHPPLARPFEPNTALEGKGEESSGPKN